MRFLTAAILSISLLVPGAIGSQAKKPSRFKSIVRSVGAFAGNSLLADPYQDVQTSTRNRRSGNRAMPAAEKSSPENEKQPPPAERSETPQSRK